MAGRSIVGMALPLKKPVLPTVSLYLGVGAVALIPFGFVVDTVGTVVEAASRSAGLILAAIGGLAFLASPGFAIAAIVTGHVARRRYPTEGFGRAGMIVGYVALGFVAMLMLLFVVTWLSIRTR